ncbi:MAG: cobalamin-binding protein [Candidatus Binatia bacterium]
MRVVSLVPSLTETIVYFGLIDTLVARTRYCVEPPGLIDRVEAVGGTKNPDVHRVVKLQPDLVVVSGEENRPRDVEFFRRAGLRLFLTHPRGVEEAAAMLEELALVLGAGEAGSELAARCRRAIGRARQNRDSRARPRAFCPIWRRPWMTFSRRTYIGDMLSLAGGCNVFAESDRGDYFEVNLAEVAAARPEIILFPDEPYAFDQGHAVELAAAGLRATPVFVDGKDLSWYGPRIPRAIGNLGRTLSAAGGQRAAD